MWNESRHTFVEASNDGEKRLRARKASASRNRGENTKGKLESLRKEAATTIEVAERKFQVAKQLKLFRPQAYFKEFGKTPEEDGYEIGDHHDDEGDPCRGVLVDMNRQGVYNVTSSSSTSIRQEQNKFNVHQRQA